MFDVFISYRHSDIDAVRPLAQALRSRGLEVWLDECRIEDFASIQRAIEEGLAQSKALVAWYSTRYPESLACQWELTRAFLAGQGDGDPRRRVLLINPEPSNLHIHPIELRDALYRGAPGDAAQLEAAADAVARHLAGLTGTLADLPQAARPRWFGAAAGDGSNRFVGRLPELWAIHSGLWSVAVPVIRSGETRPVVRVTGIGGSGKSLAVETYGIRYGAAYSGGIFWLRVFGHDAGHRENPGDRDALLAGQLIDFAQQLGISTQGLSTAQLREQLGSRIGQPYLWVVDDLPSGISWDAVRPWLAPGAQGRTVITTRSEAMGWAGTAVAMEGLEADAALALLTHARQPSGEAERAEARLLASDLGYHPLALELAAAAVGKRGFAEFRASLRSPSLDAMDFAAELLAAHGQALPHRQTADLNLSMTLFASIDGLPEPARDFLRLAAQLAPVPIARRLVARTFAAAGYGDPDAAGDTADIAAASAIAESLAREPVPGNSVVHTLVSRAVRFRDRDHARSALLRGGAVAALGEELGDDRVFDIRRHAELGDTVEHTRAVLAAALAGAGDLPGVEPRLLDSLYVYEFARGNYREARRINERLIDYGRTSLGEEHPFNVAYLAAHGQVLRKQGDLAGSLSAHQRVWEIRRRTLGEDQPDTVTSMSNVAVTLFQQGELSQARQLQERVLEFRAKVLSPPHPDTLVAMTNLALTLGAQGDLSGARRLQEWVLAERSRKLGEGHPETLEARRNLAETLRAEGRIDEARRLGESISESRREQSDEDHPDSLTDMNNLAATLYSQGDFAGARQMFARVLELRERQLGEEHPDTIATMINLGAALIALGQPDEAKGHLERALDICRRVLEDLHPQRYRAAYHLVLALTRLNDSTGRAREVMARDLVPFLARNPADLPADVREIHAKLAPILASLAQPAPPPAAKPWWRKFL